MIDFLLVINICRYYKCFATILPSCLNMSCTLARLIMNSTKDIHVGQNDKNKIMNDCQHIS